MNPAQLADALARELSRIVLGCLFVITVIVALIGYGGYLIGAHYG